MKHTPGPWVADLGGAEHDQHAINAVEMSHWNDAVRARWDDARRWFGTFGHDRLADVMGISNGRLSGLICGKYKATPRESAAAKNWKGGPMPV